MHQIFSNSRYIVTSAGNNAYPYINNSAPMNGMVRYNNYKLEVYDGCGWHHLNEGTSSIGLSSEAESLLDWVREQYNKQLEIEALAKTKPAVAIAIDNLNKAKAQLEATVILSKEHTI